jgi:DNA-binding NarL/FixJ family response regulator
VTIRVAVADDQPLVRAGFAAMVRHAPDLEWVGEATTGEEAVSLAHQSLPDVMLMDIRMPVLDGIEATRRILADPATETVRVLVLTTFDLDEYVYAALQAGASGFVLKDIAPEQLFAAIRVIAAGDALLAPGVTRRLIAQFVQHPAPQPSDLSSIGALTEREREVLGLVAAGLSNQEISARIIVSPATAKTHVGRILTKLNARDRAQLVMIAYESGLVTPGSTPD